MISLFRCEMWPKCTLKTEEKRAENVPFLVFLSSVIIQFLALFFSFSHLIKRQLDAPFYFHFSAFSSFSISSNKARTLPLSFKCSPSSLQLKCPLSPFAFSIKIDLDNLALSTQHFCGSKELLLRWNVAPFTAEKEWYCRDFCAAKRNESPPLDKEEREKWKEKEYFLKKTKRTVNEKRKNCK